MKYLDKLLNEESRQRKQPAAQRIQTDIGGSIVTRGKHGTQHSVEKNPVLVDTSGNPQTTAKDNLKKYTAGPKGPLPGKKESTVYHDMGYAIAEALGLVSETRRTRSDFIAARDTSTIKRKSKETGHSGEDLRRAGGSTVLADIAKADRERKAARKRSEEDRERSEEDK